MNFTIHGHFLGAAFGLLLLVWGGHSSATPARLQTSVSGTWDAEFSGIVQGTGTSQTDHFVIEVRQNGSGVTGTLWVPGLDLFFPLAGEVEGTTFTYAVQGRLEPGCEVTIEAETTVDAATGRIGGPQTQSSCEGTAVGQVTAIRR